MAIIGVDLKQDFTILGNKVNLAAWLETMTRELNVRFAADRSLMWVTGSNSGGLSLACLEVGDPTFPLARGGA